jgi:hypothetical protein
MSYLWSPEKRAHRFQGFNTIAEYFEGGKEWNSQQSIGHAPQVRPKKKKEQNGDRV